MLSVPKPNLVAVSGAPEKPADASAMVNPKRVDLSKPITTHQGQKHYIEIREPNAADYMAIGRLPFDVRGEDADRRATVDFKLAGQWAARLTDLDEIILGQLPSKDWLAIVSRINTLLVSASLGDDEA